MNAIYDLAVAKSKQSLYNRLYQYILEFNNITYNEIYQKRFEKNFEEISHKYFNLSYKVKHHKITNIEQTTYMYIICNCANNKIKMVTLLGYRPFPDIDKIQNNEYIFNKYRLANRIYEVLCAI